MQEILPNTPVECVCVCVFCIKQFVGGKLSQSSFHQFVVVVPFLLLIFWGRLVSDSLVCHLTDVTFSPQNNQ